MDWIEAALDQLAAQPCGYLPGGTPCSEPTALAALALRAHGRAAAATQALDWLAQLQAADGTLGPNTTEHTPCWFTSLTALAWRNSTSPATYQAHAYQTHTDQAIAWILQERGIAIPETPLLGHNPSLIGWPWVSGTHSWIEPTAWSVLALKATGHGDHDRTREAVRLLIDRLLPHGGCNYGNTLVMGQELFPHVEPSGLTLIALVGESDPSGRLELTRIYLESVLSAETTSISLAYGLLGLTAHQRRPTAANDWLAAAAQRTLRRDRSPHKLALLLLAATEHPLSIFTSNEHWQSQWHSAPLAFLGATGSASAKSRLMQMPVR